MYTVIHKTTNIKNKFNNILAKFINNRNNNKFRNNHSKRKFNNYIKFYRNLRIVGSTSLVLLLLISFLTIYPIVYKENYAEATAGTAVASDTILTLSEYSSSAGLELLVRDTSGTFARSGEGNTAKFTVSTNNFTGYTLSISSNSNDGKLNNESAGSYLSTIDNITSESVFSTSTALNGMWGYLPSKYNSLPNNSFLPSPTTTATTLDKTTTANPDTNGNTGTNATSTNINDLVPNEYTIGLGARVDYTKPAGTYTGTFIIMAIANKVGYAISYADNTGDSTVANLPNVSSSITSATEIALSDTIPTRTGRTFSGWCLGTVTSNGTVCNSTETLPGTIYPASTASKPSYFGIDQTDDNVVTLYAMWTIDTYSLTIDFSSNNTDTAIIETENGIASVKVCLAAGDCIGDNLIGTITSSGGAVNNLTYHATYYLYPTFKETTYTVASWANNGAYGTLGDSNGNAVSGNNGGTGSTTTSTNPTFTIGAGDSKLTLTSQPTTIAMAFANADKSTTMQNMTSTMCDSISTLQYGYLSDSRDAQTYTIGKMKDGKCWMMDNLNLDLTDETVVNTLTQENTNATTEALGYLKNGGGVDSDQWANSGLTLKNWTTESNSYISPLINLSGACSTTTKYPCTYDGSYTHESITSNLTPNRSTFGNGFGKIGVYYNYCAASAGSYCYDKSDSGDGVPYDICPSKWRIPTGGANGEYQNLCAIVKGSACSSSTSQSMAATNVSSIQYQLSIPLSGDYNSGTGFRQGVYGTYWSTTYYTAQSMYTLYSRSTSVDLQHHDHRSDGRSIRCLLN